MRYQLFGKSGLRVSELALGTMTFGKDWGWGASKKESRRIFDAYTALGGNFIDTADRYTGGTAEELVGEFIASDRQRFVVATKFTLSTRKDHPNASGSHRKHMVEALEASLRRLNTPYVDLLWVHAWDQWTPLEETLRALDDLVRAGKVLYVGVSDTPAWVVARANTLAELRGWTAYTGLQLRYSLADRAAERDLLPMANYLGVGVTAWSVLGAGVLTGKYNPGSVAGDAQNGRAAGWEKRPRDLEIAGVVLQVAQEMGCTTSQVALSWVRQQAPGVIPILGARSVAQLQENMECLSLTLSEEHMQRLEQASAIDLGFPHDFLASDEVTEMVYAGFQARMKQAPRP
ncbi:MAG: aldo/keto reductase [Chloroflexi bacterium]|nr:aldo/keto reductase [Anaerolineaceae bacterium]NMB90310.1 aldo/keto reductase [Chloroflexota bacterium]